MSAYRPASAEAVGVVCAAIAGEDEKIAMKVARILPLLVVEAGKVGELVDYDGLAGGLLRNDAGEAAGRWAEAVAGRGMRAEWFERLAAAITTGAIEAFTAKQAVEILLQPKA